MALKNYTSEVPAMRSISKIEEVLAEHGARKISKDFTVDGKVAAIEFCIETPSGWVPFRLDPKLDEVTKALLDQCGPRTKTATRRKVPAQAERTAWKILSDLVEIQTSRMQLDQAEICEVFLPHLWSDEDQKTLFQRMKEGGLPALPAPK